ncbi:unnamed protein product [Aphanomyces euteiches]|uniref:Uncharacterized protein n=1 Tax=Aphanomyces euteiches TaxID=100861 RepID=A0A6G0XCK8_9STRA|nr:hypothetical protein Ae201684_006259 [Aphanomyces euteiches]KAH9068532.1 hypothetical protein Ae201684P_004238 [Aphanomyces euteiches]KAH9139870.1 hypothetical protein AeRB84_015846 [Aphanomyces euteiches]
MDPPAKKRKTQVRFDAETDLDLVKEVLAQNPYNKGFSKKRAVWDSDAASLNIDVDGRRCRQRCALLSNAYAQKQKEMHKASSVEETITEMDELLSEILELREHDTMLRTSDQDEGAAIRKEEMKTVGDRKPHNNLQATMIAYMSERDVKSREFEDRRLTLEERRLEIEERKAAHEAERFALEKQERLALIKDRDFKDIA